MLVHSLIHQFYGSVFLCLTEMLHQLRTVTLYLLYIMLDDIVSVWSLHF